MKIRSTLLLVAVAFAIAAPLSAQSDNPHLVGNALLQEWIPTEPGWGITANSARLVDAASFEVWQAGPMVWNSVSLTRYCSTTVCEFVAGLDLPNGAQIIAYEIDACDTSTTKQFYYGLSRRSGTGTFAWVDGPAGSGIASALGCTTRRITLATPRTVDNVLNVYRVQGATDISNGTEISIAAFRILYRLQVSPAPGTATFTDVSNAHPFYQFIEALAASGITGGCAGPPLQYCPDAFVTRGQMAAFLARALGLHFPN